MKTNHHLPYKNWDVGFPLFLFNCFLGIMLLSESSISRIFLKPNRFWLWKKWWIKYRLTSERNVMKNAQNDKIIIIRPFTWNQIFLYLKKLLENCNVNADMKVFQYICLYIKTMSKVLHYNTVYFLRHTYLRYMICLFTNIQKQEKMLKSSLLENSKV